MGKRGLTSWWFFVLLVLVGAGLAALGWSSGPTALDVIHETESPYQSIFITERDGVRRMHVGSLRDRTSALDLEDPRRHVFEYTALMLLGLGYVEPPRNILVVGLGGGTITRALRRLCPEAAITNVEFDPEIVAAARTYFGYAEDERMRLVVRDARQWLRNTPERFDLIVLDAYHGGYIPFHLTTREFLELVRSRLAPGGAVCANTWVNQRLAERESATYAAVFGTFHHFLGRRSTNRIIVAMDRELPEPGRVRARLAELTARWPGAAPDLAALFEGTFAPDPAWPPDARVLVDDHAPVNLLKEAG